MDASVHKGGAKYSWSGLFDSKEAVQLRSASLQLSVSFLIPKTVYRWLYEDMADQLVAKVAVPCQTAMTELVMEKLRTLCALLPNILIKMKNNASLLKHYQL